MITRDTNGIQNQRFKERRTTTLNVLPPEISALIGKPQVWPGIDEEHAKKRAARRARKAKRRVAKVVAKKADRQYAPNPNDRQTFYGSWEWRKVRMQALQRHGRRCQCCGARPDQTTAHGAPVRLVVDHIKPLGKFWHLRLDPENVQVLCDECNMGKGDWDMTDYRPQASIDPPY